MAAKKQAVEAFGYKTAWFAVKGESPERVAAALGKNARAVTWKEGVAAGYASQIFVTPATRSGWVLAMSTRFMDSLSSIGDVESLLARVPAPEVQFFATHRVVDLAVWALARNKKIVRVLFAADGEFATRGEPLPGEPKPRARDDDDDDDDDDDMPPVGENVVMEVAGAWSVNPQLVGREAWSDERGLLVE